MHRKHQNAEKHLTGTSKRPFLVTNHHNSHGLVPQLWSNYSSPTEPPPENVTCNVARMKCAYRPGCGLALENYALGCTDLTDHITKGKRGHRGRGKFCPSPFLCYIQLWFKFWLTFLYLIIIYFYSLYRVAKIERRWQPTIHSSLQYTLSSFIDSINVNHRRTAANEGKNILF